MIRLIPIAALAVLLAACGQSVTGTPAYVTVGNVWSDSDALPKAEEHCQAYNKHARFKYIDRYRATFDCVSG